MLNDSLCQGDVSGVADAVLKQGLDGTVPLTKYSWRPEQKTAVIFSGTAKMLVA